MAPQGTAPKHVRRWNTKLPVHLVQRAWNLFVRHRRSLRLAADDALNMLFSHQFGKRVTGDVAALPIQLTPDITYAVDAPDPGLQGCVAPGAIRQPSRIGPLHQTIVAGGWGDRQNLADRPFSLGSDRWRLDGQAPCLTRRSLMNPTITQAGDKAPSLQNTHSPCADLVHRQNSPRDCFLTLRTLAQLQPLPLQRLHLHKHVCRDTSAIIAVDLDLPDPLVQDLGRTADLCGDRHDGLPPRFMLRVGKEHLTIGSEKLTGPLLRQSEGSLRVCDRFILHAGPKHFF